jgi:5'-methylthioadenosine phosphorylase
MADAIGIIGGSGLYEMDGFQARKFHKVATPFGKPSDDILEGRLHNKTTFFLPRHARGHRLLPSEINYRANIYALKKLGVRNIIAVTAVGSLQSQYEPGHLVLVDQYIDRTKGIRKSSFFGEGIVGHIPLFHPTCRTMGAVVSTCARDLPIRLHQSGTYLCIEGPAFSTPAESVMNHDAGFAIIGMTGIPEAYLAREAGICYCSVAMVTDYDSWNEEEEYVNVESVMAVMRENVIHAKQLVSRTVAALQDKPECHCRQANKYAIMTDKKAYPKKTLAKLKLVLSE